MFLLLSFEWSRSSAVFFMGDEPQRYPIKQGSRKFLICGKRRNRDRPMPQSGSQCDKRIPTRQRLCLTCSTHWVLRTTWSCLITLVVNPKDLNKDRGLTKMSPLFLFTLLIPEIIVHDVSFAFIRVKQLKYCLFHGRWAAEVPKTKAKVLRKN